MTPSEVLAALQHRQTGVLSLLTALEARLGLPARRVEDEYPSLPVSDVVVSSAGSKRDLGNDNSCNGDDSVIRKRNGFFSGVEERLAGLLDNAAATFSFKRVPSDYYDRSFEERRDLLGAASIDHLCKSIVMVNTQAPDDVTDCSNRSNSKYYVVVIQYVARLNAEKVKQFIYSMNNGKLPKKRINMRLAPEDESNLLTGFEHNAVTPFGMATDIPVILSDAIVRLQPQFFWLGGGEVDLKLGIRTNDFLRIVNPFIADCS